MCKSASEQRYADVKLSVSLMWVKLRCDGVELYWQTEEKHRKNHSRT